MPEPAVAARCGLFTSREEVPVPLSGVSIEAEISHLCARVVVTQRYVNRESTPIEAVYLFPLEEGAAVCGFEALIDGTLVVGEVKEREEAFRMYDDAMARGDGAFLLDEERADVFQASVGNLLPGKEVVLKLTYVTELTVDRSSLRFSIPTTVSPRYAPEEDRKGIGRPDSETLNPPVAFQVPYGLSLSIRLAMQGAITRIESPSHPVSIATDGNAATVTLASRETALDRDFILSVETTGLDAPQAWLEREASGHHTIAVAFVPKFSEESAPCDVTFLVDRSGSMQGPSILEVRNALQLCLRSMISGCRFNIVGFGSSFHSLFPESRPYDERSLAEGSAHVASLEADLGGTEILPALQFVLGQPAGSLPRQVVVLTDGEVTNTDAVLALAHEHSAKARIFTFGIGAGASHHLVKGLARAGGGTAEFIHPGERIEPKVVRQFGRLLSPALNNVRMDWGGLDVTPAPSALPPVFSGGRLLVYALGQESKPTTLRLTADGPSGPLVFEVPFDPDGVSSRSSAGLAPRRILATLAARARIRELEESPAWLAARGSRQHDRRAAAITQEIVALGVRYGLVSRATSFVAIERRETPVGGDVQLRRVPVALTAGWGGGVPSVKLYARAAFDSMPMRELSRPASPMYQGAYTPTVAKHGATRSGGPLSRMRSFLSRSRDIDPGSDASSSTDGEQAVHEAMHELVRLQRVDGLWDLSPEFAKVIGCEIGPTAAALAGFSGNEDDLRRAWATALALAWLRTRAAHVEDEWRLLARKAQQALDGMHVTPPGGQAWTEAATRFLSASSGRIAVEPLDT